MIRIHDLSDAYGVLSYRGGWNSRAIWFAMLPIFYASGDFPKEVSVDIFEPDIIGEEIHYGAPVFHKWSSIRHFKTEADILPLTQAQFDAMIAPTPSRTVNYLNPRDPSRPLVVPFNIRVGAGYFADQARPLKELQKDAVTQRLSHSFLCEDYFNVTNVYGEFFCHVLYAYPVYTFMGKFSYSPYQVLQQTSTSVSVSLAKWDVTHSKLGRFSGDSPSVRVTLDLSTSEDPWVVRRFMREWCQLNAGSTSGNSFTWIDLRGQKSLKSAMPVSSITVHSPNYDAVFAPNRRNPNWYELAERAYQSLGMSDINGVAYITELFAMGEEVIKFSKTLKSIPSSKVKAAASAWLAVHYGFKLTLLDTKTLRDTLEKQSLRLTRESKCQSATTFYYGDIRFTARYQVFYNQFAHLLGTLDQLVELTDAALTSENLWDMVPFSFVIDWFVRIGDVLQSLDNFSNLIQKHEVVAAGKSISGECLGTNTQLGLPAWVGGQHIKISCYLRRYERRLQSPSLVPSVTVNPFNHLIEGAALVISRK